jgi:hypothetical protein
VGEKLALVVKIFGVQNSAPPTIFRHPFREKKPLPLYIFITWTWGKFAAIIIKM